MAAVVRGGAWAVRVARPVGAGPAVTRKAARQPARIRVYDSWGCPGATRETRDALGSPFCCSRTSHSVYTHRPLISLKGR